MIDPGTIVHGHRRRGKTTPTYHSWEAMIARCAYPYINGYELYGGAGIIVCDRWKGQGGFVRFLQDMGERPDGHSIDRIDPDGNYEPGNCRWATYSEQARGRRLKSHCKHGHEFTPENTRVDADGWRVCRICATRRQRDRRAAKRATPNVPQVSA